MASQAEKYRTRGDQLTDNFFNRRFLDLDLRVTQLEQSLGQFDAATGSLVERGLQLIQEQVQESVAEVLQAVQNAQGQFDDQLEAVQDAVSALNGALESAELAVQQIEELINEIISEGNLPASAILVESVEGLTAANVQVAIEEILSALGNKAADDHVHAIEDITDLDTALGGKADAEHGHEISDVTGLETALSGKASSTHSHAISDITDLESTLSSKADSSSVVAASRKVEGGGLASGGGDLTADRTITVTKASASEFRAGTEDGKALTPKTPWDAAAIVALTDAGTISVNMANFINAEVTLGGNRTLGNPSNAKPGQSGTIYIVQDGTGGRTLAFSSYWKFAGGTAPAIATNPNSVTSIHYKVRASNFIEASIAKDVK